jgi:DNA-binding transcriptional ArsR family regulator
VNCSDLLGDQIVTYNGAIDDRTNERTDESVFKALADRGRRALLDALFDSDGRTLGELCEVLPAMTRFGVMKHLAILAEAGLVVAHKVGRSKLHYLNPVPIRQIQERWIAKYAQPTVDAMVGLRRQLESDTG